MQTHTSVSNLSVNTKTNDVDVQGNKSKKAYP